MSLHSRLRENVVQLPKIPPVAAVTATLQDDHMLARRGVITCLCITAKLIGDVRYGSKASFPTPSGHVRYYPQSDRNMDCALSGGHLAGLELTGTAGLSEDESHGQAALP